MATYAISDIHGCYNLFQKVKDFIKPEDKVYVLGDCGDRGPKGWDVITEVYNNPQFIYIKGNHEDMLAKSIRAFFTYEKDDQLFFFKYDPRYAQYKANGGESTFKHWMNKGKKNPRWATWLSELPTHITYVNTQGQTVELSHAGFNPWADIFDRDYIWDREHYLGDEWYDFENTIIVHGHTPMIYVEEDIAANPKKELPFAPYWYAENHKVDIDCGCFATGGIILLNLDTWEYEVFKEDGSADSIQR